MIFDNTFDIKSALKNAPFLHTWWSFTKESTDSKKVFTDELERELYIGHPLYGLEVEVLANGQGDDYLFEIKQSNQVCTVHLTRKHATEIPPYPITQIYESLDDWYETDYIPDFFDILGIPSDLSFFEQNVIGYAIGFIGNKDFENYLYMLERTTCQLTEDEYLTFIALDFNNTFEVLIAFNQWFRKKFNDARYDLLEMHQRFSEKLVPQ